MVNPRDLSRPHVWQSSEDVASNKTLLLLHGSGADEHDLLGLGKALDPNANLLWVQDEPANQGPWSHIALRTSDAHGGHGFGNRILRRISRRATASPATGSHHLHEDEQKALLLEAFTR